LLVLTDSNYALFSSCSCKVQTVQPHINESANYIMCIYTLLLYVNIYVCLGNECKGGI